MSMRLRELRDRRGQLLQQGRALLDKAEQEKRELSPEEKLTWEKIIAEQDRLREEIAREERQQELERELAGKAFSQLSGKPQGSQGTGEEWVDYRTNRRWPVKGAQDPIASERTVSLGAFLRGMLFGAQNEAEERALSEGSSPAGGFAIPSVVAAQIVDNLRAEAIIFRAGARIAQVDYPEITYARLASDPVPSWHLENLQLPESEPSFEAVVMKSRTLSCLVRISRELAADGANVEVALTRAFIGSMAAAVDKGILSGVGATGEPLGLLNDPKVPVYSLGTDGGVLDWDAVYGALEMTWLNNAKDPTAFVLHPRSLADLETMKDGEGLFFKRPDRFQNVQFLRTTQLPIDMIQGARNDCSAAILGDFADLTIGMRQDIRVDVLNERFAEFYQVAFLVHARLDYVTGHEKSFVVIKGILPIA